MKHIKPIDLNENTEKVLTVADLKAMEPGKVFAHGEVENSPKGIYMSSNNVGRKLIWAAERGNVHDWTIYIHWADSGLAFVLSNGDKVGSKSNIEKLVPCDDEAFLL